MKSIFRITNELIKFKMSYFQNIKTIKIEIKEKTILRTNLN
jgi:hypothetical protein